MKAGTRLAIFDTFKTKDGSLTGEAKRQRAIISILADDTDPAGRTRTGIAQSIAKGQGISWKNIYSGIFRDIDEILLPMGIAAEEGRLPLKRGPKALQEKGVPFYRLTREGVLVSLAIGPAPGPDTLGGLFSGSGSEEKEVGRMLSLLFAASPKLAHSILGRYVESFCKGTLPELLPLSIQRLGAASDGPLAAHREVLGAFAAMPQQDRDDTLAFLDGILEGDKH